MPVAMTAGPWLSCACKVVWKELRLGKEIGLNCRLGLGRQSRQDERIWGKKAAVVSSAQAREDSEEALERGKGLESKKGPSCHMGEQKSREIAKCS